MLRAVALTLLLLASAAHAQTTRSHAITILGTPALPPDFPYFPYVNPQAPKGGEVVFAMVGSFDGFNPYILRGNAALGLGASWQVGVGGTSSGTAGGHVWESLLVGSADEVATGYGHLAQTIEMPADRMWVAFEIRPEARFSDGSPVTAQDVVWTFNTLMEKGRPSVRVAYQDVKDAVAESDRRVVFHFKSNQNRELPLSVGGLPVLPMKWWATRDFTKPLTEPPLGSGPYKVEKFELGRTVTYVRDPNWWAREHADRARLPQFRPGADRVFPRPDGGVPGVQGGAGRLPAGEHQQAVGDRLRLPGGRQRARAQGRDRAPSADRHPGLDLQHAPAAIPGRAGARGAGAGVRLRVDEQEPVLWRVHAHDELFRQHGAGGEGPAGRGRAEAAGAVQGQGAGSGVHASRSRWRRRTAPATTARGSGGRWTC